MLNKWISKYEKSLGIFVLCALSIGIGINIGLGIGHLQVEQTPKSSLLQDLTKCLVTSQEDSPENK